MLTMNVVLMTATLVVVSCPFGLTCDLMDLLVVINDTMGAMDGKIVAMDAKIDALQNDMDEKIPAIRDDPCLPNPCQNGGKCCATCPDYTCTCTPGWTGKNCTESVTTTSTVTATTTTTAPSTTTINRENNTLVQQNIDGSDFFVKNWTEYKAGFGNESGNYWIGNERLHELTKTGQYKLRVDLLYRVANSTWYYAEYSQFIVGNETSNYKMSYSGFNGTMEDYLFKNPQFSTNDVDNDGDDNLKCAADKGGFWYPSGCGNIYINSPLSNANGFSWRNDALGDSSLQTSRMRLILMQQ